MSDAPRLEDVAGVPSRMNWGAVFAGAAIALACNLILTLDLSEGPRRQVIGRARTRVGASGDHHCEKCSNNNEVLVIRFHDFYLA